MNVVFWFLVIVLLGLVWFQLSFVFKHIGNAAMDLYEDAKEEITGDNTEEKESNN